MNSKLYDILVFMEIFVALPISLFVWVFSEFSFVVRFLIAVGVMVGTFACVILFFLLWVWLHTEDKESKDERQSR